MISKYLREQKRYTQRDLCALFECSEEKAVPIIQKLKEYGVLKAVKASDLQRNLSDLVDEDIEVADVEVGDNNFFYVFTFVGVIIVAGCVLKCYPKYIYGTTTPSAELRKVVKVLEKYNSKEQIVRMFNDSSESSSFNLLAVLLLLLQDYYDYGVYSTTEEIIESNGTGEILWEKTINDTFALISNNRPYYFELQTKKRITDDYNYFQKLHECILTNASKELLDADLMDLFDLTEVDLSEDELYEFGEEEYILYRIEKELNQQFNTRKQLVLKTIYAYISHRGSLHDLECFSLFGTNSFNLIWEGICAEIMDNQLDRPIGTLKLPCQINQNYNANLKLKELIEKPLWTITGMTANDTLIPDLIAITQNQFVIFDAKYYTAQLEPNKIPRGQPGIESITKQYLYQLAYQQFINDHGISCVKNCFLMPTENKKIENMGEVSMKMLSGLGLQNIQVRLLPADLVYDYYLAGKKFDIAALNL